MPRTVVAQISDPHVTGPGDERFAGSDPAGNLARAIAHASRRAEAIVITGDLAARAGTDAEYEGLRRALPEAGVPVLLAAGNHDDQRKIRALFGYEGTRGRLDYVHGLSRGSLVVLDTSRPGREDGELDEDQAAWLDGVLAGSGPSLVAMHHPCFAIGGPALAGVRLDDASIARLAGVVSRHDNVLSVVSGHAHMTLAASFAGTIAQACPSSAYEFDFRGRDLVYRPGHPRYMEYSWIDGGQGFHSRMITAAPEDEWLVMESF